MFEIKASISETQAIFKVVLRNLELSNWQNLETEAQFQMIKEVELLLQSKSLSYLHKQQIKEAIDRLENYFTSLQRKYFEEVLESSNPKQEFKSTFKQQLYYDDGELLRSMT